MISAVQDVIKEMIYADGRLDKDDISVEFESPTKEWESGLSRPTINFFLFDFQENASMRQMNMPGRSANGISTSRLPPRHFELQYFVSVFAENNRDQQEVLWRTLAILLKNSQLPYTDLSGRESSAISTRVGQAEDSGRVKDLWAAFQGPPRPSLIYVLSVPVDLEQTFSAPMVFSKRTQLVQKGDEGNYANSELNRIGGEVLDQDGGAVEGVAVWVDGSKLRGAITDGLGRFELDKVPTGLTVFRVARPGGALHRYEIEVPSGKFQMTLPEMSD